MQREHKEKQAMHHSPPSSYCGSSHPRRIGRSQSGAALIVALAILLVLLSIAITFALIVRLESDMAAQVYEGARADNLLDGALAKTMHRLNTDLETHPDALSLDHSWRSWFSGSAFVGKMWARESLGEKAFAPLAMQGLVRISIEEVERALLGNASVRDELDGGRLYARFIEDARVYMELLFRGPRTEHWLLTPRNQDSMLLLFPGERNFAVVNRNGEVLDLNALNAALGNEGRPERFRVFGRDDIINRDPSLDPEYPFVTASFYDDKPLNQGGGYPSEQVHAWADVDNDGDGMRDSLWMPLSRDIDHFGDWLDNDLDGFADPMRNVNGEWLPLFEAAPFVYHSGQRRFDWDSRTFEPGEGGRHPDDVDQFFLTMPLPGLTMQVDLNSDGLFDERDHYCDALGCGPVLVRLPDMIYVSVISGLDANDLPIYTQVGLTREDVDLLDNDFDFMVNNLRTYAYVGPHNRLSGAESFYLNNQIPSTRNETFSYDGWYNFSNPTAPDAGWAEEDRNDPQFATAHQRGYHDINVDMTFLGNLSFFFLDASGAHRNIAPELEAILRRPNALRITCSGEPVSAITGRAAIQITDEAGKVNLNIAGGHVMNEDGTGLQRALHLGATPFEYETRMLPNIDTTKVRQYWGMRTGALSNAFNTIAEGENEDAGTGSVIYGRDVSFPGYGLTDDNGNALLLSLTGWDNSGSGYIDDGLYLPKLSPLTINVLNGTIVFDEHTPQWMEDLNSNERPRFNEYFNRLGRFEGIDEAQELRLFNPLRNLLAESDPLIDEDLRLNMGDRLLLRKEELTRHHVTKDNSWEFLRNLVTVNSDSRNVFSVEGHGLKRSFLSLDPNTATPQHLTATLLIKGDVTTIIDRLDALNPASLTTEQIDFSEGLRQFDTAFSGALFGMGFDYDITNPNAANYGARFPADPVLQTLRLALDIVSARERSAARHTLVMENMVRNTGIYEQLINHGWNGPLETLNERERILDGNLMPAGDIQEYLQDALGIAPGEKRLIAPDPWWHAQTGEDRLFQYAASSGDVVRINELMVRPVRRVEAETQPSDTAAAGYWDYAAIDADRPHNLNPAPSYDRFSDQPDIYPGMVGFDVITPAPYSLTSLAPDPNDPAVYPEAFFLKSVYDYKTGSGTITRQPLLGDSTVWEYAPENFDDAAVPFPAIPTHWPIQAGGSNINPDMVEFRFRASDGLPPGRYYLKVNVTDAYGNMTITEPGILQYSVKYINAGETNTITANMLGLLNEYQTAMAALPPDFDTAQDVAALINGLWQTVDHSAFLATPDGLAQGSASPVGWAFLPIRSNKEEYPITMPEPFNTLNGVYGDVTGIAEDAPVWPRLTWTEIAVIHVLPWFDATVPVGCSSSGLLLWQHLAAQLGLSAITAEAAYQEILTLINDNTRTLDGIWVELANYLSDVFSTCPPGDPDPTVFPTPAWMSRYAALMRFHLLFAPDDRIYFSDWSSGFPVPTAAAPDTYTVMIPETGELCIAFRLNPENARYEILDTNGNPTGAFAPRTFAINFFDFSQEPSHEYVELVNVTEDEVDLTGWTLEIGIPDPPGATHNPPMKDPFKSIWRIPALDPPVRIAPKGHLLLGFDVFDGAWGGGLPDGEGNLPQGNVIGQNGMGLAKDIRPEYAPVTVPPIGWAPSAAAFGANLADDTGSVFHRENGRDYVDNDGDGLTSATYVFDSFNRDGDTDHVLEEFQTHGTATRIDAFARFVQLENEQLWIEGGSGLSPYTVSRTAVDMRGIDGLSLLAHLVLRGGVLPDYPERDGIDNDGDGGYVFQDQDARRQVFVGYAEDGVTPVYEAPLLAYVKGTLDKDMIDNNLDGYIDGCGKEPVPVPDAGRLLYESHGNPLLSEGVDEGRLGTTVYYLNPLYDASAPGALPYRDSSIRGVRQPAGRPRMYGPGSYEAGRLPLWQANLAEEYRVWQNALNGTDYSGISGYYTAAYAPWQGYDYWRSGYNNAISPVDNLLSSALVKKLDAPVLADVDAPEWKAFVERRWNPGDNVMVTLYAGPAADDRVADQVSYREYDVINRTLDDIIPCPYRVDGFVNYGVAVVDGATWGELAWLGPTLAANWTTIPANYVSLDPDRPCFWLPDHMALDFYRSLERKHPLHHGDRFGLANRWTPTSGAYDDWADSLSVFVTRRPRWQPFIENSESGKEQPRFLANSFGSDFANYQTQLFAHAFWGSPLRMNTQARIWENPKQLAGYGPLTAFNQRPEHQFSGRDTWRHTGHDLRQSALAAEDNDVERRQHVDWALRNAKVLNRSLANMGELLTLPFLNFERVLDATPSENDAAIRAASGAPSPVNTRYWYRNSTILSAEDVNQHSYTYDPSLTSALLSQSVWGGGGAIYRHEERDAQVEPRGLLSDALAITAMNPVVLTVGQARVAPLWPAPPYTDAVTLSGYFAWDNAVPPLMWTPVYLFDLPNEQPWQQVHYLRQLQPNPADPPSTYRLPSGEYQSSWNSLLRTPAYLFNGRFITNRLNQSYQYNERWPVIQVASIPATNYDPYVYANRAVMYISRHRQEEGDENRAETLFVWDKNSGLENGTYMAYVGTYIPGLEPRGRHIQQMLDAEYDGTSVTGVNRLPLWHSQLQGGDWYISEQTGALLGYDPECQEVMAGNAGTPRFDTVLALEFITDRATTEQMRAQGDSTQTGLTHPRDWYPDYDMAPKYRAGRDGYIFYSTDPYMQWRPIPVQVTNNFLALRVRNMGNSGQVACISHVVLAPAPRTRGQINLNTAELKRVVRGVTSPDTWTLDLFSVLMGVPGIVNVLHPYGTPGTGAVLAPPSISIPKSVMPDPWRAPWPTPNDMIGSNLPPAINARTSSLNASGDNTGNYSTYEGRAALRLLSLMTSERTEHPEGRYYTDPAELLAGIYLGGITLRDIDGPWPLSNLGRPQAPGDPLPPMLSGEVEKTEQVRFDEIVKRFSQIINMTTLRSDVFEIIATVQSGSVTDSNGDLVMDYRGDEFYPQSERRARIIYDRRARRLRMDEARDVGQN